MDWESMTQTVIMFVDLFAIILPINAVPIPTPILTCNYRCCSTHCHYCYLPQYPHIPQALLPVPSPQALLPVPTPVTPPDYSNFSYYCLGKYMIYQLSVLPSTSLPVV